MTNIREVARRASVSPITVSRVMHNHPHVRPETRARVLAAVDEVGYVPNAIARSLKQARTGMIALIVTDMTDAHFGTIIHGVQDAVQAQGRVLLLGNSDDQLDLEQRYLRLMGEQQVDGVILVPAPRLDDSAPLRVPRAVPLVLVDRSLPGVTADVVRCDTRSGTQQLCRHLIRLGRRRIALVGGLAAMMTWQERIAGYCAALAEAGLQLPSDYVIAGDYLAGSGARATRELLARRDRPDAIIAANAKVARGVFDALAEQGLRVPEDVAVAAIDDPSPPSRFWPSVTAVLQPGYAMGEAAVRLLGDRLGQDAAALPPRELVFSAELKIGVTCGEAASAASAG